MATAEHIKNLIKAHFARDDDKFKTSVLEWKKIMPRFSVTKDNRSISIW